MSPEHGLCVYFVGVVRKSSRTFCKLRETLRAQIVPFPGYLTDTYVSCNSYSCIPLKLAVIYLLPFNPRGFRLYDASLHRPPQLGINN